VDETHGYCLLYPDGYSVEQPNRLTFAPASEDAGEVYQRMERLYATVIAVARGLAARALVRHPQARRYGS
jgi:hypothetical protein